MGPGQGGESYISTSYIVTKAVTSVIDKNAPKVHTLHPNAPIRMLSLIQET